MIFNFMLVWVTIIASFIIVIRNFIKERKHKVKRSRLYAKFVTFHVIIESTCLSVVILFILTTIYALFIAPSNPEAGWFPFILLICVLGPLAGFTIMLRVVAMTLHYQVMSDHFKLLQKEEIELCSVTSHDTNIQKDGAVNEEPKVTQL